MLTPCISVTFSRLSSILLAICCAICRVYHFHPAYYLTSHIFHTCITILPFKTRRNSSSCTASRCLVPSRRPVPLTFHLLPVIPPGPVLVRDSIPICIPCHCPRHNTTVTVSYTTAASVALLLQPLPRLSSPLLRPPAFCTSWSTADQILLFCLSFPFVYCLISAWSLSVLAAVVYQACLAYLPVSRTHPSYPTPVHQPTRPSTHIHVLFKPVGLAMFLTTPMPIFALHAPADS